MQAYLDGQLFGYLLVVARLGAALMFVPALGETDIPMRVRLSFALVLCLVLYPATPVPPMQPGNTAVFARLMAMEVTIGIWIGMTARIIFSALNFAGYQIGQIGGLANAFAPSLGSFEGSTMLSNFLMLGGIAAIFVTNAHFLIIRALLYSYRIFPFGQPMLGDMAQQMVKAVAASFYIGLTIAAPFLVMGMILNLGLGLANRMMATLPVFFVAGSILIAAALFVLVAALPSVMQVFLQHFSDWLGTFTL